MTIAQSRKGDTLTIMLEGRLDTNSAPELEAVLKNVLPSAEELIFDLEKLDYVSSAGLRVLLSAYKAMLDKKGVTICNANELVKEIFGVTGFDEILKFEK